MPPDPPPHRDPPRPPPPKPAAAGPWERLAADLKRIGGSAAVLADGVPLLDRGTLTVSLPGGMLLAQGRRATRNAEVVDAVARHYSERVSIDVIALPDTGTASDRRKALAKKVLDDPDVQRVVAALGATLLRVVPLTDGE